MKLEIPVYSVCSECNGEGRIIFGELNIRTNCARCKGVGKVLVGNIENLKFGQEFPDDRIVVKGFLKLKEE